MNQFYNFVIRQLRAHKQLRYLLSGGSSVILEYGSFVSLIQLSVTLLLANAISFIIGIVSGFVFHKLWSFGGEQQLKANHQVMRYAVVSGINFVLTSVLISYLVTVLHIKPEIAKAVIMVVVAVWTYIILNRSVFRSRQL